MVNNSPAMQETRVRSLGREESLEKGMETHSRILAWSIPQTEEPGRLQSIGWLTVPQDWVNDTTENKAQPKDNYTCDRNVGSRKKSSPFPRWLSLWKSLSRVWPEPVWLLCPWDSPDKNTAVGNHSLLQESLPQELPGSTTLKAGSLSHQGNSNQQKKKKRKEKKEKEKKRKTNLSASIRGLGSVRGERKIWLVYLLSRVQSAILSSPEKPHGGFMDIGLPLCLSWKRICLQCGRPGFHPWVGKILAKEEG